MNNDQLSEVLSAYLDGESRDPEAVERLLESDPAARRRYDILLSQSQALRRLPSPEAGPEFAVRLLARLREQQTRPYRGWVMGVAPWMLAAAVAFVLAAAYLAIQAPPESRVSPIATEIQKWREIDPDLLDSILLERIAADPDALDALESEYAGVSPDADGRYAADGAPAGMYEDLPLDTWIEDLNPDEEAVFRELLVAYAMEG